MIYRNDTGDPLDLRSSYIVIIVLTYISAAVTKPYAKQCIQKLSQNETPLIPNTVKIIATEQPLKTHLMYVIQFI